MSDRRHTTAPPATEEHARQGQDRHDRTDAATGHQYARGGIVRGPDGRADNTPAVLHPEDFPLIRLKDLATYGRAFLDAINHARPPSARQHDFEEERP